MIRNIEIVIDEQRFLYVGDLRNGSYSVPRYTACCAVCGRPFVQNVRASAASRGHLVRRCVDHRQPGPVDIDRMHWKCREAPPLLEPASSKGGHQALRGGRRPTLPRPRDAMQDPVVMPLRGHADLTCHAVVRALLAEGGMTSALRQLGVRSGSSQYRVIMKLKNAGWIEMRVGRKAYQPTAAALAAVKASRGGDAPLSRTANATKWADQTSTKAHGGDLDRREASESSRDRLAGKTVAEVDRSQDC